MLVFVVFGGILLLVAAYFALDWWSAGRSTRRSLPNARHGQVGNADVDYDIISRQSQMDNGTGGL